MSSDKSSLRLQRVPSQTLFPELSKVPVFAEMKVENLECLGAVELIEAEPGAEVAPPGSSCDGFYVVLQGEVEVRKEGKPGEPLQIFPQTAGESFGEMPLLKGVQSTYSLIATAPSRLVRFDEESFWQLMFSCPRVRAAILGNMARRLESYQVNAVHREKLASLGTLAAGLMHELNNPGAAALRAASQLRENLARMQEIGLRFTNKPKSQEQLDCMRWLQTQAMRRDCCVLMGSLEQSDREEALADWLEQAGVENAWRIAPGLADMGMDPERLACTRKVFEGQDLSDTLNWLESVISNIQLVSTIESSIARVTDLVVAVKKYAYEGKGVGTSLNVHESLHSTLIILGHKLRHKAIVLRKHFASDLPSLENAAAGLNQVWTNLLDNAIDASRRAEKSPSARGAMETASPSVSPITDRASPKRIRSTSSSLSLPPSPSAAAPVSVWTSRAASWNRSMAARSRSRPARRARNSSSISPSMAGGSRCRIRPQQRFLPRIRRPSLPGSESR